MIVPKEFQPLCHMIVYHEVLKFSVAGFVLWDMQYRAMKNDDDRIIDR